MQMLESQLALDKPLKPPDDLMSPNERGDIIGAATVGTSQATAGQQAMLARQAMGAGPLQAGYLQQASQQLGGTGAAATAAASQQAAGMVQQRYLAEREQRNRDYATASGQIDKNVAMKQMANQQAMKAMGPMIEKVSGSAVETAGKVASAIPALAAIGLSDARLKLAITPVGASPSGIPRYTFTYRDDPAATRYHGAMAQDLLKTHPHAVLTDDSGYYKVDYALIDVDFHVSN
jgi:hypothetical protein